MPSTTTTTVTIGSILDLIGPATQPATSSDGQSGFDTLLQATQSAPTQPTPSSTLATRQQSPTDSHPSDGSQKPDANEPRSSDHAANSSNQDQDSTRPDPNTATTPPAADTTEGGAEHPEPDHSDEKTDDQLAADQVIAQSLAGLPIAPKNAPAPTEPTSLDVAAANQEDPTTAQKSGAVQANNLAPANPDSKDSQPGSSAQSNKASDDHPQQTLGGQLKSATAAATEESTTQKTAIKAQAADKAEPAKKDDNYQTTTQDSQQDAGVKLTGDEKPQPDPTQTTRHDQSTTTDTSQPALDATSANSLTADAANQITAATPLVAPATAVTPGTNQPDASQSSNSGVSNAAPRTRLPAQALVPAANASTRHAAVEIDAARLISRVVRAFSAAQERDGEVRLRLSPPELGSLRLDVRVENGVLSAHLQTETDSARLAILDNLPALRDRLAEQGVRIERFDVDLMQQQPGGMPDQPGGRQPDTPEAPVRFPQPASSTASQPIVVSTTPSAAVGNSGVLNVIV